MTIKDIRPTEDIPVLMDDLSEKMATRRPSDPMATLPKDRKMIDVEITSQDLTWLGRRARVVLINDITERKRGEERLLEQADIINRAQDAIIIRNFKDQRITFWNKRSGTLVRLERRGSDWQANRRTDFADDEGAREAAKDY